MEVNSKNKNSNIKTGDNSKVVINKNSNNKKWTKKSISIALTSSLTFGGLTASTGYLLHSYTALSTKVDIIINNINKLVIKEIDLMLNDWNLYDKNIIRLKLEMIKRMLINIDEAKYSNIVNIAKQKIAELERKLNNEI